MEVAPFFVDFHHFLSIFTIFYRFSRFTHFCRDLHFVAIYAIFPQIFFGQNSLLRNITRFLHVWLTHPAFKREDRLGKEPFAGFGTVVEDITESGYTKNQPILLGPF